PERYEYQPDSGEARRPRRALARESHAASRCYANHNSLFMDHLLAGLAPGSRVLDLGARAGSFHTGRGDLSLVRLDLEIPASRGEGAFVAADAALMPFIERCFHLIISNHSLEHFSELETTLREIGRVIHADGALFIAVPDAGTFTVRIYRWLARGGGQLRPFPSALQHSQLVVSHQGMYHTG